MLGEAYAFGVVWSLVLKTLAMLALRYQEPDRHRAYRVPLNLPLGRGVPVGLALIFLVLLAAALANLMTKTVATSAGIGFTAAFLGAFTLAERLRRQAEQDQGKRAVGHKEQFTVAYPEAVTAGSLGLEQPHRKIVALGSVEDLELLDRCLVESDPATTEIVVIIAHPARAAGAYGEPDQTIVALAAGGVGLAPGSPLGDNDRTLMTAVVNRSELAGKPVRPVVIMTDEPLADLVRAARALGAHELFLGGLGGEEANRRLRQAEALWCAGDDGQPSSLTIRVGPGPAGRRDLGGGSEIPRTADGSRETARTLAGAGVE